MTEGWYFGKKMSQKGLLMFPTLFGGSESTFFADGFYHNGLTSGLRGLLALGTAGYGGHAGVGCLNGNNGPGNAWVDCGAALCEAAEDWDTEPFWQA